MNLIYYYLSYKPPWIQASAYASPDPKTPYEDVQCKSPVLISGSLRYPMKLNSVECCVEVFIVKIIMCDSLFVVYLTTQGVNPREHPVKSELVKSFAWNTQSCM